MVAPHSITTGDGSERLPNSIKSESHSPLKSDVNFDTSKLAGSAVTQETINFNQKLQALEQQGEKWYNIGAAKYRELRKSGLTPLPGAVLLPTAIPFSIPSRDSGRKIPCRIFKPLNPRSQIRGVFLHFHGGGWVLNDEESSDPFLQNIANLCHLICISCGYRLAPEHPYPAAPNDCLDAAQWLIDQAPMVFRHKLSYIGGESAGASLALVTTLALLRSPVEKYSKFHLDGLMLHYGTYSMHWLPRTRNFRRSPTLIIDQESLTHFRDAYLGDMDTATMISPEISPLYAELDGLRLPRMLVTCGTEDCLLEDSIFMSIRWNLAGGSTIVKLYPGSPHGFIMFSPATHANAQTALEDVAKFVAAGV